MRLRVLSVSSWYAVCLGATCAMAQSGHFLPYGTHMDRRHGNDHVYPDRGAIVRDVPHGAAAVDYAGISFRFAGGVWYEPRGPAYIVAEPPIGVIVPALPAFATSFDSNGKRYLYANDVFYRAAPDLGGYEVVNDPEDEVARRPGPAATAQTSSLATAAAAGARTPARARSAAAPTVSPVYIPADSSSPAPKPAGIAIRPRAGQSAERQSLDRYECYRYAVVQSGFDPRATHGDFPPTVADRRDFAYALAQAACLEGRGYAVSEAR